MLRIVRRSFSYIRRFYGVGAIPLQFMSYTSSIYYLMVNNIDFLKAIFPTYADFLKVSFIFFFLFVVGGYIYTKKTGFVQEDIEISREVNPYSNYKVPPVQIPSLKAGIQLYKLHKIDTTELEKILEASI